MPKRNNRYDKQRKHRMSLIILCLAVLFIPTVFAQNSGNRVKPSIPESDRYQQNRVFLEFAEQLSMKEGQQYQLLIGNVQFRKGDMFMYCDSAHFYDQNNSLNAFGNVKMEQGDTLFVYADELDYDGQAELAVLYADPGKKVKLINKDVMLETDVFNYDLGIDLGYYEVGGVLTDKQNRLSSLQGEYSPSSKDANFYLDVHLNSTSENDTLDMYTDTLSYNTYTHIAQLVSYTDIYSKDGVIHAWSGTYNTNTNISDLYERSVIVTKDGNTLVVVTADHETGAITLNNQGEYEFTSDDHSEADVPLRVYGSEKLIKNGETVNNYEIPIRIAYILGFTEEDFPVLQLAA